MVVRILIENERKWDSKEKSITILIRLLRRPTASNYTRPGKIEPTTTKLKSS